MDVKLSLSSETTPIVKKKWLWKINFSFNRYYEWASMHNCDWWMQLRKHHISSTCEFLEAEGLKALSAPYFAWWLTTAEKVQVRHTCQVTFAISDDYKDTVWCDVLPLDSGDILLGRQWVYDKNETHGMCDNTYTFFMVESKRHKGSSSSTPCLHSTEAMWRRSEFEVELFFQTGGNDAI